MMTNIMIFSTQLYVFAYCMYDPPRNYFGYCKKGRIFNIRLFNNIER